MRSAIIAGVLLLVSFAAHGQGMVTSGGPVYSVQLTRDVQNPVQVGNVVAGKPCDAAQRNDVRVIGTLYLVPHDSVTFFLNTDAEASFAKCEFALNNGMATLTWVAPTKNDDGTPLTNLSGYNVYWGTVQGAYPNKVTIPLPEATGRLVQGLAPGKWYFVVTALAGTKESAYSNVAAKIIP